MALIGHIFQSGVEDGYGFKSARFHCGGDERGEGIHGPTGSPGRVYFFGGLLHGIPTTEKEERSERHDDGENAGHDQQLGDGKTRSLCNFSHG